MPVERKKTIKRSSSSNHITMWATVEPTNGADLAFAPNVTPISYTDSPPPLVECPPTEFIMFPPSGEQPSPRRQPHSKKKPENHIPRPPNAFILFRSSFIKSQHVSTAVETNHSTLSKIIGLTWSNMPEEERQIWHLKAKEALDEHKRKFPKYAFKPIQTKTKSGAAEKRKVREVEPKDNKRCAKIAQLLVEGKKGAELNAAVHEFDKTHVPEIITRFEAPITARAYRRSSSAPVADTSSSRSPQSFMQTIRSTSMRPATPTLAAAEENFQDNAYLTIATPTLPLKQEPDFNFGEFSFETAANPLPMVECDPYSPFSPVDSFSDEYYNTGLTIDTSFSNSWPSSPCPASPATPNFNMSPMSASSPISPYDSFDGFDHMFESQFPSYEQTSGMPQQEPMICGGGGDDGLYAPFEASLFSDSPPVSHLDLVFTNFMSAISQFS